MKKVLGLITLLLLTAGFEPSAFASLTISKMDMENRMAERAQAIATKADPSAFVQVHVKLKKIKSKLSFFGMETQVTPLENGQDIGPESIESIEVKVLSKLEPFPEWLQKEIATAVALDGIQPVVSYAKPETPLKDITTQLAEFFTDDLYASIKNSMRWGIWGVVFLMLVGFGSLGWLLMNFSTKLEAILQKVIAENLVPMATALGQIAGANGGNSKPVVTKEKSDRPVEPSRITVTDGSKNQFADYPVAALNALFIDCYWTHQDGYAHYLWTLLSPSQRESVMKAAAVDVNYFTHILSVPPKQEEYHSHAWYMNPHSKMNKTDQKALSAWLKKNLHAAHVLSPLRLDFVELSLEERLSIATQAKREAVDLKELPVSTPRTFATKLRLTSLSEADELYLLKNYSKVHPETRPQLRSLVWLAVAPMEKRKKILDQLDARQLAEAWSAPKPVLDELQKGLSPKKLEMLEHFLKTNEAGRNNDVFTYLVEAGLEAVPSAVEGTGHGPVPGKAA